jgi:hypothetical protein
MRKGPGSWSLVQVAAGQWHDLTQLPIYQQSTVEEASGVRFCHIVQRQTCSWNGLAMEAQKEEPTLEMSRHPCQQAPEASLHPIVVLCRHK